MALLTPLGESSARALLGEYGLDLVSLQPLAAGSVNSNFFVRARGSDRVERQYFARIYEEQDMRGAEFELRLNVQLDAAGIPVARPVRRSDGSLVSESDDKPFALYERLVGEIVCQGRVTPQIARGVGKALAGVHVADLGTLVIPESRFGFDGIRARLDQVRRAQRPDLSEAVEVLAPLADRLEAERARDLPSGLIHGDLFRDNVLVKGQAVVGLLDFESASSGPYIYDLLVTVLAWCFASELRADLCRAMVEGYLEVRALTKEEVAQMTVEGSVACLRFATTRLTDFSLRVPPGTAPGRDYRRFFERRKALEDGYLSAALAGLF